MFSTALKIVYLGNTYLIILKMNKFYLSFCLISGIFHLGFCAKTEELNSNSNLKPNIIFILADDLGWSDLPLYGNNFNEAPNITKLANDGIQFSDAYVAAPVCSPARASIISGQYPARVGITDYIVGHWWPFEKMIVPTNKSQYLPLDLKTIGEILKNSGYRTGYFGKWHLGGAEYYPDKQGFDESVVYQGGGYYDSNLVPNQNGPSNVRLSEVLTDLSINFIE